MNTRRLEVIPLPRCPACNLEWPDENPAPIFITLCWTPDAVRVFPICWTCHFQISERNFDRRCRDAVDRFVEMDRSLEEYRRAHVDVL